GDDAAPRNLWTSFLKTPEARKRSALCSLTRRVVIQIASNVRDDAGKIRNPNAAASESFDVDWGTGTIWNGTHKIASATHRKDANRQDDFMQLRLGWVDIRAVAALTGATWADVTSAFQQEP
ncbi:pepD, partial [Symbiodinium sp. CCMP2456]